MDATRDYSQFDRVKGIPPLRESLFEPDEFDEQRALYAESLWTSQDGLLRQRDRQIEENIRMLLGQQWIAWSDMKGRFVDLADTLSDEEKQWRAMPVMNRLFLWFVLTHSRMTESPPVLSWQPGPDRIDAELAEVLDPIYKYLWRNAGMLEVLDRAIAWMIPCGRVFLKSVIDPMGGDPISMRGPAELALLDHNGNPTIKRSIDDVPHDQDGNPLAFLTEDGEVAGMDTDPAHFHEGSIGVQVLTALEARGEWGEHIPWHQKRWHQQRSLLTPLQVYEQFGVEIEPDVRGAEAESVGILFRLLHGTGLFGASEGKQPFDGGEDHSEFITVLETWHAPSRMKGMQRTKESAGGRLMITTGGKKCIRDGIRPVAFKYTSPIRCLDFINLPGRPAGSSPQEQMNGPVRTRNRLYGQGIQHATMAANPIKVFDIDAGIEEGQLPNVPGAELYVSRSGRTTPPLEFVSTKPLGREVYETADRLASEVDQLGSISGTSGEAPTDDSSGELVEQLRFNSDRPIGSTMKRMVYTLGRQAEDWRMMLPVIFDEEKVLSVVGDDQIPRTISVWPELFEEGTVDVEPAVESMLPEGRQERQARVRQMYLDGLYGQPGSPQAINAYLEQGRFPHMARAYRPGGVDRTMAGQNVGKLMQGTPATQVPIFPWYEHQLHVMVLEQFMKSPEYLKQPVEVMQEMVVFRTLLLEAQAHRLMEEAGRELGIQAATQAATQALTMSMPAGPDPQAEEGSGTDSPPRQAAAS